MSVFSFLPTGGRMHAPHVQSGGRYPVLRALAIMYVLGSALAVLATLAGIVWIFARAPGNITDHLIMAVGAIVGGFVTVVTLLAVAELLKLFIDIEHNTRTGTGPARMSVVTAGDTVAVTTAA